ncbi:hypothetical protein JTE90_007425 [Oedothorax gibbosus]|uniref:Vitellogenin n=1 Tax=Oedothorax gibbosus TaxID=931172 RepID=A0AAV6UQN1_9ARAC|nr:hypothetical protein JTE90_007425 [Oedothorax gibbosus]
MVLRLAIFAWLGCLVLAGPIAWDDSKCAQKCNGGAKYQYSELTNYIYLFESFNELKADGASDLSMNMKAKVKLTSVSKCEMVLQLTDVSVQHGPLSETSSAFIEALKRHPLPFSWDDGKIEHVCPSPDDSDDVNNVKKAIVSALQNSMRSFEVDLFDKEVDVLGSCDTEYKMKSNKNEKFVVQKDKNIATCTDHLKHKNLLLASFYESSSQRQHLPLLTGESLSCRQTIEAGLVEEVVCEEKSAYKPLSDYGYVVETHGKISLQKVATEPATPILYRSPGKESLVYKYSAVSRKDEGLVDETRNVLKKICEHSEGLLTKESSNSMHRLVYLIRSLSQQSLETIHASLKSKELCRSGKTLTVFVDALKAASSGGSIGLLSKLVTKGDLSVREAKLWFTLMPFTSYVEEGSIAATIPLLNKDSAEKQALLGVSALAYKYCSHDRCKGSKAVRDVSSRLKQFLGDKCQTANEEEESKILTALKSFGNLGYIGESADAILECANLATNKMTIRISAIEAFRRTPCTEDIISKVLDIYKNKNEEDEVRIASLIALSKCASNEVLQNIMDVYESETSKQVEVFTWSYLENLESTFNPIKSKLSTRFHLADLKRPSSTDITKFSRNFQSSLFSELLNIGYDMEANIVHSRNSFLPRSSDLGLKIDFFGNELNIFQVGARAEDLEHVLEHLFGPRGLLPNVKLDDVLNMIPENLGTRRKRSADSYKAKIEALSERLGFSRGKSPHGSAYFRVLGHELAWVHLHKDMFKKYDDFDLDDILRNIANTRSIDIARNLLFLDFGVLFPSVTGRAYKLSANASLIFGLKTEGKINIDKHQPRLDLEASVQPSILNDMTASFTIHSENFEPGVRVESVLHAGVDFDAKIDSKAGRLLHVKLSRRQNKLEVLSLKRTIFSMSHKGVVENPAPESYHLNYCTKYIQHFLGVRYCASATIPHIYNAQGKPKIPFVRAMKASLVAEKTDTQMEGYELIFQIPEDFTANDRTYKFLLDTPNSSIDRRLSLDLAVKNPKEGAKTYGLKLHNPFYSLDIDVDRQNSEKHYNLKINALASGKRRYSLLLDMPKDVRGARLVEYQPKLTLNIHHMRPIEIAGTIVYARGRKDQITINLESSSFDTPLTIKGNLVKEGIFDLEKDYKLQSDINITAFSQIHRLHSSLGNKEYKGVFFSLGHHFEPDGRSYESVSVTAKIENIELRDRLQFSLETKILLAEHQDLNSMLRWDFSLKPFAHLKNDIIFRYGENFDDDKHLLRLTHIFAFSGDFDHFQKLDIENKLGVAISCLDFHTSGALSLVYDLGDKPKFFFEAGLETAKDNEISIRYDYKQVKSSPLKVASEGRYVRNSYTILYKNEVNEVSPNVYEGKAIINPAEKEITIDYVYKVKDRDHFHHEFDGTVKFPEKTVKVKVEMELTSEKVVFHTVADTLNDSPYSLDVKLQKAGTSDVSLQTPYIEGTVSVDSQPGAHSIRADIKSKGRDDRRVVVTGNVARGDINTLMLDIAWDADNDAQKKISIKAQSHKETEDGIEKHMITAAITYIGSINVDVTGKISTHFLRGPHFFRAEFSGNMEPMAIEFTHDVSDGQALSVLRYLRSNVEKLRLDMKGKYIFTGYKFETEYGLFLSSPYKTFDGKELFFRIMADSNDATREFVAEYRIRPAAVIGYVGKVDYVRKRGYPGQVKSTLLVTVHQRPVYEGSTIIDYGNGKYSWKSSFTPITKRKVSLLTSFEHSGKFAAFHHSFAASLRYLQKVELNAVADLRNLEDAKIHSNLDINKYQLYDVNSTLKMKSIFDFDTQVVILSKITPSLRVFSKAQTSGQMTKYDANLEVDSVNLITGSGEVKKRKKGFNGDMTFKYKEKELLHLIINQESKVKTERNYVIKAKTPWRSYQSNIKINKEKGSVKYETKFCGNEGEGESCISIDAHHKEVGDIDEWQIDYKRNEVEFSIERIRVSTDNLQRFQTVLYKGDKRYGYDLQFAKEDNGRSLSFGIILPSRKLVTKTYAEFSIKKPRIKFQLSADARRFPDSSLSVDIKLENHIMDNKPSKLDVIIANPLYEKPIELQLIGDYQPSSNKFLTAQMSADYSTDPEDKLIGKFSLEHAKGNSALAILNVYHKDDEHLDFVIKLNGTVNNDEEYFGLFWDWKDESDSDVQAFTIYHYIAKERRFYFEYNRPKFVYRLDGSVVSPKSLLGDTCELDLNSVYNGETTKAKLIVDFNTHCYKLLIFNKEGETKRIVDLYLNEKSRKVASILMESLDDEGQWTFDYSLDIVRKSWRTLQFKQNFNPEFLGSFLFQMTSLGDELTAAGVGSLPISDSPQFKKIKTSINNKIIKKTLALFLGTVGTLLRDLKSDFKYADEALRHYYSTLPALTEVKEYFERACHFLKAGLREIGLAVESYYRELFKDVIAFLDKTSGIIKAICDNNQDCKALVKSFNDEGWEGLCKQLRIIILEIPERINEFLSRPNINARKYFDRMMTVVKAVLRPLTKLECGEIVVKIVQLTYTLAEPHIQSFLENYPRYYTTIKETIATNKYYIITKKMAQEAYLKMKEEVQKIPFERLYALAKHEMEEYLFQLSPPSARSGFTVHTLDTEKGVIDVDIHFGVAQTLPAKIFVRLADRALELITDIIIDPHRYGWSALLVKVKRVADLNFFPPYDAQAMIVDNHHFVTFDKAFYDYAGECTYLLSRDFEDGNFTFALKPKEGDKGQSILALINDISIEVNNKDKTVLISDSPVELPYITADFTVSLSGSTIVVDDRHHVQVRCNLVHHLCTFNIPGWFYGKTAGLLGTYNYESSDEFKRPKGQIANSATVMAKSWELKKGCKSNNLLSEVKINENAEYYRLCEAYFEDRSSPLSACFYEVEPKEYFELCVRSLARAKDTTKALCTVSAAYVTECERNYVELSLPSKCLTCTGPNGSTLQHGDRKKFENLSKKTADVIFLVEDHDCNKAIVADLANLAKSIDRELQNDGFKDTMFGVVGFGGDVGDPQAYTIKGTTFFNSRDIGAIKDRLKLENKKSASSRALEAMKLAVKYIFRGDSAKSFVLLSCSACKYDYKSLQYPVVHQILLERGISLHVIGSGEIKIRKGKEKDIIGADPDTVFHTKDVSQPELVGEPALRSQVVLPKDLCVSLSQDVDGSYFSTHVLSKASEAKNWRSVFARKFLKSIHNLSCQLCDCTSTRDHVPNTVCQPCQSKRPRLPFSLYVTTDAKYF